ncbi:DUF3306 domain-containing protein [Halomonas sp. AOP12-C2-37]|uniref:DUF3306 domain-containing protein n=1 Tax=Halomonas casei TaxID=2742613 RepID=A0ABR9EWQ6_9GAMM|nr:MULTISPECIES: DUF3306 domain-containing protein [Halomonas]MBE0398641.1 DUF3306 domain-containing protein [Halomonas casei]PCC21423.1 hypothetical protein CIK78_04655 [Halomonas sp. JB37]
MSRLERWSRLKRNAQKEGGVSPSVVPASEPADDITVEPTGAFHSGAEQPHATVDQRSAPALDAQEPEREPAPGSLDHTLPDPDTLGVGSDFSAFMLPGVSGALRRRALKRLWATGNYNVRDGLDDYDADYRQQLKPMASGLASKLRSWTHKVDETLDKPLEDASAEPQKEQVASEQSNDHLIAFENESAIPGSANGSAAEKPLLDDQSDLIFTPQRKSEYSH